MDQYLDQVLELREKLLGLKQKHDFIKGIRGMGLIIGLELDRPGAPVVNACRKEGFLINCTQDKILRFIPPLIIEKREIDQLIDALDSIFERLNVTDWK